MKILSKKCELKHVGDEFLAVAVFQGHNLPFPEITKFLRKDEFMGKPGQLFTMATMGRLDFKKLFLYGVGEEKDFELDTLRKFAGAATRYAHGIRASSFSIAVPDAKNTNADDAAVAITEGAMLASYKCTRFKSKQDDVFEVKQCTLVGTFHPDSIKHAETITNAQNYARAICELPPNMLTPHGLASYAKELAKECRLSVSVFEKDKLEKMGMNGIIAVGKGSANPPVLVTLEYNANKKNVPLYAIVGKGVTFDSGGISIKPSKGMQSMKYDKTGAVVALGIMKAAAELHMPIRLIAIMPIVENLPSGSAQKPSDIVKMYNGKTVEVLNTDAEGRIILGDALAYAAEKKPDGIIDLATLTGAMVVCLGSHGIGLFSNDDALARALEIAGKKTHERVWRFPLWKEYTEMIKGDFADIKNIGSENSEAGSITAACFLKEFVGETKWAHLDIAGVDNIETTHAYLEKGSTCTGVRLVIEALLHLTKKEDED